MFIGVYNLPGLITFTGLALAFLACYFSFQDNLSLAIICLIYAGVCDTFDGAVAKRTIQQEEEKLFGVQIDSLVDMVSFGLTPAIIAINIGLNNRIELLILMFYVCAAAMRLAYFNIYGTTSDGKRRYYTGLPVTFSAMIFPVVYTLLTVTGKNLDSGLLEWTFIIVAFLFILNFKVPKPGGIFYFLIPLAAIFMTAFWLVA